MRLLLAVDPGPVESAYVIIDRDRRPLFFDKIKNEDLRRTMTVLGEDLTTHVPVAVIEMIGSYGMAVGAEVFETCVWIGRFSERWHGKTGRTPELIKRGPIKLHHCHSNRVKDSNIRQALVDRFAPGQPNHGKGTKAEPGWFHGFHRDIWQAYALAVYAADQAEGLAA